MQTTVNLVICDISKVQVFQESVRHLKKNSQLIWNLLIIDNKSTARFCQIFEVFLENLNFTYVEFKKFKKHFKHQTHTII